jgi:hypothetical protein
MELVGTMTVLRLEEGMEKEIAVGYPGMMCGHFHF